MLKKKEKGYAIDCFRPAVAVLSGCQINPYTFQPNWTSPDWLSAGKEDAINGLPVKDNQTLADSFNDPTSIVMNIFAAMLMVRRKCVKKALFMHGD